VQIVGLEAVIGLSATMSGGKDGLPVLSPDCELCLHQTHDSNLRWMFVIKLDNETIVSHEERRDSDVNTTMQVNHGGISIETTCVL